MGLYDQSHIMATDEDKAKKGELNNQLKEYIHQWREERSKEEEELKRLKEKQSKRKEIRVEQEKKLAQQKRAEEEKARKEEAEKRQEMMAAQKEKGGKKSQAPAMDARKEMSKSKEQVEEEMKISLSIRIKPLALDEMDSDEIRNKCNQIWNTIVVLETDKYDYEQRQLDQDYEFKELAERQKLQLRKKLYEGGAEVLRAEALESAWKEKFNEWSKRPKAKLPKWFGVRPGKKEGDPETPEGEEEEEAAADEEEEEDYDEEEEEEEEEEE